MSTNKGLQAEKAEAKSESLQASESNYRRLAAIVEASDDAIVGEDLNGIITSWNKGAEKIFGYTADEMVGTSILRLVPADKQDEENQTLEKVERGESVEGFETMRQTKEGRLINVSVTVCPIKDNNGNVIGVSKVARDITMRKEHEREIVRLSRLYAALSQINQAIVWTHRRDEMFEEICRVLVEFGGFRMAWIGWLDAKTRQVSPIAKWGDNANYLSQVTIYAEDRPEGRGPTGTAVREGKNYVCNDFVRDPRTLPWHEFAERAGFQASAAFPIRQGGVVRGALTIYSEEIGFFRDKEIALLDEAARDVSFALDYLAQEDARQQAVDELRWKTAFLEAQVDSALDGILVVDNQGKKILQNHRMIELWKIPPHIAENKDDAVQAQFAASRTKDPKEFGEKVAYLYSHPDEVSRDEIELIDGTILDRYSSPVRDKAGTHYGRIWTFRDITERRKLEAQFRQSQKMEGIGQLAAGVAHDFNNILSVIQMQVGLLKSGGDLSPEQLDYAEQIGESTQRAANLTRQLLLFSRKHTMQLRDLDLTQSINEMTKILRRTLGEDIELQFNFSLRPLFIHADPGMMDQVLLNLAVNARDAMPKGGRLAIETSAVEFDEAMALQNPPARPGSFVCFSMSDTGSGIAPEHLSRIFEPFFTTKEVGKGTGLGLATVFGIVQQHHGWINAYSEAGRGTTFRIYLPRLARVSEKILELPALTTLRGGNETILLVEDELSLRTSVRETLLRLGYRVLEASSGVEALDIWKQHRDEIHLLLTDLVMPGGMTGKDMAARLLQENPKLKVIYTSGYSSGVAGKDFSLKEGINFLNKPFQVQKLAQTIRDRLDKPG